MGKVPPVQGAVGPARILVYNYVLEPYGGLGNQNDMSLGSIMCDLRKE